MDGSFQTPEKATDFAPTGSTIESHQIKITTPTSTLLVSPQEISPYSELLRSGVIQPKLAISQPGDAHEGTLSARLA